MLSGHGLETDRPARTFQADTPLSGARSANIDKKTKVTVSHNKMTNVNLASGRGVPSTKSRIVIRCRVAGPNEVSMHEEGGTAERRNWGFSW